MADEDDVVVDIKGWFREDSRLMYADVLVYAVLKGKELRVAGSENEEPSIAVDVTGAEIATKERNYKIVITTSSTKIRLYAISRHEFNVWSTSLRRVAHGDLSKGPEDYNFDKPPVLNDGGDGPNDNLQDARRNASVDVAHRSSSLDNLETEGRATSLDIHPNEDVKQKGFLKSVARRLAGQKRGTT